jgi:hypothetical protein
VDESFGGKKELTTTDGVGDEVGTIFLGANVAGRARTEGEHVGGRMAKDCQVEVREREQNDCRR